MNHKYILIPLVAGATALTSCKDKTTTPQSTAEKESNPVETLTKKVDDLLKKPLSAEERASKMGFASRLPKDISVYSSFCNGRKAFDRLLSSKLGAFVMQRMADEGLSIDDLSSNPEVSSQIAMYSEEYFTAYGAGSGDAIEQAVSLYEGVLHYSASLGVHMADAMMREGENFNSNSMQSVFMPLSEGPLKGAPAELVKIMQQVNIPAVYQGAKISDAEQREQVMNHMKQGLSVFGLMQEISEPLAFKKGDSEFTGYKVLGNNMVKMFDEEMSERDIEQMKAIFDMKDVEDFKKALSEKEFVIASGVIDDYVLIFFGGSVEDFVLVDKVEDSFCASDQLKPLDPYLGKDLLSIGFADGEVNKTVGSPEVVVYRLINGLVSGLEKGVSNSESLGDMQDMEVLLSSLKGQGEKLMSFFKSTDQCAVTYIEDGIKAEIYGGSNVPSIDFKPKHSLASMGDSDDVVFFANWTSNEEYNTLVSDYVDTLAEAAYLGAGRIAGLSIPGSDFKQFQQGFAMFDQIGKKELVELSGALRGDFSEGLGAEGAAVIDLKGQMPKVPLPDAVLKEGRIPRIAYVSTVKDREKLQSAWARTNTSIENILKIASSMSGNNIPMQVPMSSEKDGLKTWFMPIPLQNDDFVPSISVSDELFFASTSKSFSEGLTEKYKQGGSEAKHGAWVKVNFNALHTYAKDVLAIVENNKTEIIPSESAQEDFEANKKMIHEAMEALSGIQGLTSHAREENGKVRVSVHFKAE